MRRFFPFGKNPAAPSAGISILIISLLLAGSFLFFIGVKEVKTETADNISGFAWSENIGWISFTCENQDSCLTSGYRVGIGSDDIFSGYAWSENIGWLSFNETDLAGCPVSPCLASISPLSGQVSGWLRALNYGSGWDGWIRLRGTNYGVFLNTQSKEFEGWAWGGDVVGWLSFNCKNQSSCLTSNYKVTTSLSLPPTALNLSVDQGDYCSAPLHPIFYWTFSDPDIGDIQGSYQIQIDNNSNFSSPEIDSGKVNSDSNSYFSPIAVSYNTTYYWRLKVWDNGGNPSRDWIEPSPVFFTTPLHAYPKTDFIWIPFSPATEEFAQFCSANTSNCTQDFSICYNASGQPISCVGKQFFWTFPADDSVFKGGSTPSSPNPQVKFKSTGAKSVSLEIRDDAGACSASKIVRVGFPLPSWKEIEP